MLKRAHLYNNFVLISEIRVFVALVIFRYEEAVKIFYKSKFDIDVLHRLNNDCINVFVY